MTMQQPTHYDYELSKRISADDPPFHALLCALIRQADSDNLKRLESVFPEEVDEFRQRYHHAGGLLNAELELVNIGSNR